MEAALFIHKPRDVHGNISGLSAIDELLVVVLNVYSRY